MKRFLIVATILVALIGLVLMVSCTSPQAKAQKLFNEGKYEEVIAQYGNDPNMAAVVTQAKEKLAEKMIAEGKYAAVLELYPETNAAKAARDKLAEQLFLAKNYAEVIAKYPETTWAAQAKAELDKAATAPAVDGKEGTKGKPGTTGEAAAKEKAADAEYARIQGIKMKDLRIKALKAFVADPQYAGTRAQAKAKAEIQ